MSVMRETYQPRQQQPELEHEFARPTALGYESPENTGLVRCLSHGFPTPLARWHCHDECELHLITATSGKAFVGDWIGQFEPGHLVLCGPRLPHNWISTDLPEGGVAERDLVIQFHHSPIVQAAQAIAELAELLPLLERARNGIEFFGLADAAHTHWQRVRNSSGAQRFSAFCDFMALLVHCTDYRLLSNVQMRGEGDSLEHEHEQVNTIVDRITKDVSQPVSAARMAAELGMSESRFSRFFRKATGNSFTDFVNQVRINRACQLLMGSERQVTHICYEVGFQNVANFNRRFREIKGMTPSEFRQQASQRFGSGP